MAECQICQIGPKYGTRRQQRHCEQYLFKFRSQRPMPRNMIPCMFMLRLNSARPFPCPPLPAIPIRSLPGINNRQDVGHKHPYTYFVWRCRWACRYSPSRLWRVEKRTTCALFGSRGRHVKGIIFLLLEYRYQKS